VAALSADRRGPIRSRKPKLTIHLQQWRPHGTLGGAAAPVQRAKQVHPEAIKVHKREKEKGGRGGKDGRKRKKKKGGRERGKRKKKKGEREGRNKAYKRL